MIRYLALIDSDEGAYGVVFPDILGVGAMGHTVDEALLNAEDAFRDYAISPRCQTVPRARIMQAHAFGGDCT